MTEAALAPRFASRVLIVGLGETGVAAARWCARNGAQLRVADTRTHPAGLEELKLALGDAIVEWHLGCDVFAETLLDDIEQLVLSPGLAPGMSPVRELLEAAQARNVEITGEIELFARALRDLRETQDYAPKVLGITGTNGKTTVTALTRRMLEACGIHARAAGNISPAALHALMEAQDQNDLPQAWVLELSSFQLETTRSLNLTAATVLNLTQDHLDWHVTMPAYCEAKARIFKMAEQLIVNRDDTNVMAMVPSLSGMNIRSFGRDTPMLTADLGIETSHEVMWLCSSEATEFLEDIPTPTRRKKNAPVPQRQAGRLVRLMPVDALGIKGLHNALNCQAALLLARACGANWAPMLRAASEYNGEPHRMAFVRSIRGIDFFNDSKGTNVGATAAGIEGLGRKVVLIAGGVGKGQDFEPLVPVVQRHVRAVILIGQDATILFQVLAPANVPCALASDMADAVAQAFQQAEEGDAIVLSPACASFDMFQNYPHRGRVFVDAVTDLALEQGDVA
ncbi:UDP-N-acetylmuramoyl-L-alanine--D-glutamate ligase [Zwartia sp.]|uniref:UDP-N-acetylmuramoyl-L-alanine--D-glutamate ligase n=1 Tax=Zwartia sp. TaxID=2978004 RepID=UPI00271B1912|nr:UDP-N-acetylmuramoyl-L-alanine--D-glutamate ligase [Zwartia sp.]MDO9023867.1 UDP-N-acetylmuramoyl-L-alanine--D-glutamate ligase [Zwartia sp.]